MRFPAQEPVLRAQRLSSARPAPATKVPIHPPRARVVGRHNRQSGVATPAATRGCLLRSAKTSDTQGVDDAAAQF